MKTNMEKIKIHDCHECRACEILKESQEQIINCNVLRCMSKDDNEVPKYGQLFIGTVKKDQLRISKLFKRKMKTLENIT